MRLAQGVPADAAGSVAVACEHRWNDRPAAAPDD